LISITVTVLPYLQFVTTIPRLPLFLVVNAYNDDLYTEQHSQAEVETYSSRANNLLTGQEEIENPYHQPWLLPSLQLLFPGIQNSRTPVSLNLTAPYKCPRHFKVWWHRVSYRRWSEPSSDWQFRYRLITNMHSTRVCDSPRFVAAGISWRGWGWYDLSM